MTVTEERYDEITSANNAWTISDIADGSGDDTDSDTRTTNSARQIKALVEQVTDRYSPLPSVNHRFPFLSDIQMPLLSAYLKRITASIEAFETLSSSFMRAVPGALAGATHSGVHMDQSKTTGGVNGLQRLVKALLSAVGIAEAMTKWGDEIVSFPQRHYLMEVLPRVMDRDTDGYRSQLQNQAPIIVPEAT
jgi:hypothetical protein